MPCVTVVVLLKNILLTGDVYDFNIVTLLSLCKLIHPFI